jgi:hypothetical protein
MSTPLLLLLKRRQQRRQQGQGSDDTGLMDTLTNVVGVLALITSLTAIFATSATLNIQAPMAQRSKQAFHLLQANGDGVWDLQPAVTAMAAADRERVAAVRRCQTLSAGQREACDRGLDGWARSAQVGPVRYAVDHRQGLVERNGPPTVAKAELNQPKGWLDTTMAQLAQRRQVVFVVLENDGFATYRAIKAKAQQHGVRLGWEPWMKGDPIYFWGNAGRSLTVQ